MTSVHGTSEQLNVKTSKYKLITPILSVINLFHCCDTIQALYVRCFSKGKPRNQVDTEDDGETNNKARKPLLQQPCKAPLCKRDTIKTCSGEILNVFK